MISEQFLEDLRIDPDQLDVCAGTQGELFFKWAEKLVLAKTKLEKAKFELDILVSKLSNKARVDPESFRISRVTESAIETAVKTSPAYIEAMERFLQIKAKVSMLEKAVDAMEQRKRMIEVLVTLHGQEYFAGPSVPRNLAEAWQSVTQGRSTMQNQLKNIRKRGKQ